MLFLKVDVLMFAYEWGGLGEGPQELEEKLEKNWRPGKVVADSLPKRHGWRVPAEEPHEGFAPT
jgi:hypothetical protein